MKVKEESEKVGLNLNIQKTKIMASGPITSWQIDGETVSDFIFGGSKITSVRGQYQHGRGDEATETGPRSWGGNRLVRRPQLSTPGLQSAPPQAAAMAHSGQLGFSPSV